MTDFNFTVQTNNGEGGAVGGLYDFTFSVDPEDGESGDILQVTPTASTFIEGYLLSHFEYEITDGTSTNSGRLSYGPVLGLRRKLRGFASVQNDIRMREIHKKITKIYYDGGLTQTPTAGQIITKDNGASAEVVSVSGGSNTHDLFFRVTNVSGTFNAGGLIYLNGVPIAEQGKVPALYDYPDEIDPADVITGDWSEYVSVTPAVGARSVNVTVEGGELTITEGEGVLLTADALGFDTLLPEWDKVYRWRVDKTGESGSFRWLPNDFPWDQGLHEGEGHIWAFVPQTTGDVTIYCDVFPKDDDTDITTGSVTISVTPLLTQFTTTKIYAVDTTGTHGNTPSGANEYSTVDAAAAAIRALPADSEALLYLYDDQTHTGTDLTFSNGLSKFCVARSGHGTNPPHLKGATLASPGATRAWITDVKVAGDYDPTAPDTTSKGYSGINFGGARHSTVYNLDVSGTSSGVIAPAPGNTMVVVDVKATDYVDFGFYAGDSGNSALIGVDLSQPTNSIKAPLKNDAIPPWTANHGGARTSRPDGKRAYAMIDSRHQTSHASGTQGLLRLFGSPTEYPHDTVISKVRGSVSNFDIGSTSRAAFATPQKMFVDKLHLSVHLGAPTVLGLALTGVYMRNVILHHGDHPDEDYDIKEWARVGIGRQNGSWREAEWEPIVLENFSIIDEQTQADNPDNGFTAFLNPGSYDTIPDPISVTVQNWLLHSPGGKTGSVTVSNMLNTPVWSPYFPGAYRYDFTLLGIINGNGTRPLWNQSPAVTVTGDISSAVLELKRIQDASGDWSAGTGAYTIKAGPNNSANWPFQVGETVTFSNGATGEVSTWYEGTHQNVTADATYAQTAGSGSWWQPDSTSDAVGDLDAGVELPYDDIRGVKRRRDGTGARGAVESPAP